MRRRPLLTFAAAAATAALALTGCSAPGGGTDSGAGGGQIEHALGTTELPADPQRVVALGWGAADAALALGVVPIGMEAQEYGGNDEAVLPWAAERLEELGAETPEILPSSSEAPPYEAIAALQPDLILAPYSGVDQSQYDLLTEIAPTVAYPGEPWATPWPTVIEMVGQSLGLADEAEQLLADIDQTIAGSASVHPEFEGKSIAMVWDTAGTFAVYKPADPRVQFAVDLGFTSAPAVEELSNGDETFYYTLSYERTSALESDVVVVFADTQQEMDAFLAQPYAQAIPAVQSGAVAQVVGAALIASVSPPTALSLTWGIDEYLSALSEAVAAVE
ncbi:periplasmic binding protein [Pseudoclavibacter endophyticus]|uniref:Iron-siderophore ABC transporter substrate-binding protein n=1 Tax=Pseudoclavibacter endophyticus TaxID=1778590 RepID=A0A6H9WJP8_9MICO|nr:iron-siderophore ABC transporter substrate-binding protein [Pseudoclavibacter endophyticus]KAB1649066.1 iron-siderophore ABC transporter substrate-binding protein [Pseudoclavibacter endophyticus]GGA65739.1 periplasmic binding protein [Pseudoclavibacter endophyticus]